MRILVCFALFFIGKNIMASADFSENFNIELPASVLSRFGWKKEQLKISEQPIFPGISSSRCRFFWAYNSSIPGAGVINFVLNDKDELIASTGDMEGLGTVLRTCIPADANARTWAELIAAFSAAVHPAVIDEQDKLTQSAIPGYRPPIKFSENEHTHVEFFALEHNRRIVRVKAILPPSGPVKMENFHISKNKNRFTEHIQAHA